MERLKIRKSLQQYMLSSVEVLENIIILIDQGDLIVYCDKFLDVEGEFAVDTENFLKVLKKVDEESKIKHEKNVLTITRKNNQRAYTVKYDLLTKKVERNRIKKLEHLDTLQELQFEANMSKGIIQELNKLTSEELTIHHSEKYYLSDEEETIILPKEEQISVKNGLEYSYELKILQELLNGLQNIEQVTFNILDKGLGKVFLKNKDGLVFTLYVACLEDIEEQEE